MSNHDALKVRAEHVGLFETPLIYCQFGECAELRAELRAAIAERRRVGDNLPRSNVGGWHSDTRMLDWGGSAARFLSDKAIALAQRISRFDNEDRVQHRWTSYMWANVLPPGGLNTVHVHPGELWAAVFYIDTGSDDPDCGGELVLEDPRFPMTHMRSNALRIMGVDGQPQEGETRLRLNAGDMVLFPAWLRHGVRPYRGKGERISVAMNIDAKLVAG